MRPVLLVSFAPVLGGAERILLDWAAALEPPVVLACPPGPLAAASPFDHAPLAERPLARRGRSGAAGRDLAALAADIRRLVRALRPRAVVASGHRPLLAGAATPTGGTPLVALLQDLPPTGPAGGPVAGAVRAATARADAIVALSGAIARAHDPRGRRLGRTHVIHPGVDAAHWDLPDAPDGPPRALVLGALVPWKRADLALQIAARLPDLQLDFAGAPLPGDPPDFAAAIAARAAAPDLAGRVRLLGALPDPRTALRDAHVLLHCSDAEPYGLVLIEALAAGRPVVAPGTGGPLEIVTPASGRLYLPGDAGAGAAALAAVLRDRSLRTGARARAAAFDRDAAARRFAAVLERAAAR